MQRDPASRRGLDIHLAAMADAACRGNSFDLARSDTAFHRAICELSDNQVLLQLWDTLARRLTIIFGLAARRMDLIQVQEAHLALFQVLLKGDAGEISRVLDSHIMEAADLDFGEAATG